jgi:WbqC-like protein family
MHQASYFPWLGLLDKVSRSDVYLVMDEVQLADRAFQHRNLFLTADGKVKFLTIPFVRKHYREHKFREIEIARDEWRREHLSFIRSNYGRHPFAGEVMPRLERFFSAEYRLLVDAVLASMRLSFDLFGIATRMILQSEMNYDRSLRRGDLVLALVRSAGARCYLSGSGARAYLDEAAFCGDLKLRYTDFQHPQYAQRGSVEFQPGLAGLDALFNLGTEAARALLESDRSAIQAPAPRRADLQ